MKTKGAFSMRTLGVRCPQCGSDRCRVTSTYQEKQKRYCQCGTCGHKFQVILAKVKTLDVPWVHRSAAGVN